MVGRKGLLWVASLVVASVALPADMGPAAAQPSGASLVPGQVLVRYEGERTPRIVRISGDPVVAAARIARAPHVRWAEPNRQWRLLKTPNDTLYGHLWGMRKISAPAAWDVSVGSSNVVVAVVDSGIEASHRDLSPNAWTNLGESGTDPSGADRASNLRDDDGNGYIDDARGWSFATGTPIVADVDPDRHGSHVSGTIAARGNDAYGVPGVGWQTTVMPLAVFNSSGIALTSDIAAAFRYAGRMGARIVNGSLSGEGYSSALADAISGAPNTLFVVAAGNDGVDTATTNTYPCNFTHANLICVAATDSQDGLASFSNHSSTHVDLGAPGVDIASTTQAGSWGYLSGTSMASPHVAGAASLLWAAHPTASVSTVRSALLSGVVQVASLQGKTVTGGRLDAARALAYNFGSGAPPPPVPSPTPTPTPDADQATSVRRAGGNRFATAAAVAAVFGDVDDVIVATGRDFPDAVAAAGLAGVKAGTKGVPILLTAADALPSETSAAISAASPERCHVLGGLSAVSQAVRTQIAASSCTVVGYIGANRFDTAARVATTGFTQASVGTAFGGLRTALIATGRDFPDALALGPIAYGGKHPVLLVEADSVPKETRDALVALGIQKVVIAGGPAVVSPAVQTELESLTGAAATRYAGADRNTTATIVADAALTAFGASASTVHIASGLDFPDALSAGALAGMRRGVSILVARGLPRVSENWLRAHAADISVVEAIGGTAAIDDLTLEAARLAASKG